MGKMHVNIYGRDYELSCGDGQEAHLGKLAQMVNERVRRLAQEMGRAPESTMLVFTALMFADELEDLKQELKETRADLDAYQQGNSGRIEQKRLLEMEAAMADSMNHIADRLEKINAELNAA